MMTVALARAKLTRWGAILNAGAPSTLPSLIFVTDEARIADPAAVARALPKGAAILLRARDELRRTVLAAELARIARARRLRLIIAGDPGLVSRTGMKALHLPESRMGEAAHWRALHPDWLITVAAHSARAIMDASHSLADAALLSPVFPTQSHPGAPHLGPVRFGFLARSAPLPVYGLGGIHAGNIGRLAGLPLAGLAIAGALVPQAAEAPSINSF